MIVNRAQKVLMDNLIVELWKHAPDTRKIILKSMYRLIKYGEGPHVGAYPSLRHDFECAWIEMKRARYYTRITDEQVYEVLYSVADSLGVYPKGYSEDWEHAW